MVCSAEGGEAFTPPGMTLEITIPPDRYCDCISIASMAVGTNDAFVAINSQELSDGDVIYGSGYDAG
eukprot:CAMPEP_0194042220 /NCGR_PEP_ID=MMETSP0009_2-20130614/14015_1 /TAXON_ID=210454 /ORGANISM="Grammatophora oceanica, Strain CCMP 410" /LENGTH=66 /DNA_ID=CAMNT_0038685979 /DNA_START=1 /DNA_END=197 /DNA_ORIENTATION=-